MRMFVIDPNISHHITEHIRRELERIKGSWNGGQSLKIDRYGSKILATQVNYRYRAVTNDPVEPRAMKEACTDPAMFGFRIVAEEEGRFLEDAQLAHLKFAAAQIGRHRADPYPAEPPTHQWRRL